MTRITRITRMGASTIFLCAHSRNSRHWRLILCVFVVICPNDDPANNRFPSAVVTTRELPVLLPFLARNPSILTCCPGLSESLLQPCRVRVFGLPPSHCQRVTVPFSSFVST